VTKGAKVLGGSRQTLNDLVYGRRGVSPEMALRLDMHSVAGRIHGSGWSRRSMWVATNRPDREERLLDAPWRLSL